MGSGTLEGLSEPQTPPLLLLLPLLLDLAPPVSPSPQDSKSPLQFPLAALTRFAASSSRSRTSVMLPILVNVRLKLRTRTSLWPPFKSPMHPVVVGRCSHVKLLWKVVWMTIAAPSFQ